MTLKQILTVLTAVLTTVALATAPEPLARWDGDFTQTVKGDFTLNTQGNIVAEDGSSITIVPTATGGVTIDYPQSKGVLTVVVRYSNYVKPVADTAFLTVFGNGSNNINLSTNCNRCGFLVRASGNAAPIWNGALWYNATSGQEKSFPSSTEGRVAYCYDPSSTTARKGWFFTADWNSGWSLAADWGNVASGDSGHVIGCAIGGPRHDEVCTLAMFAGLTIEEIVLLPGVASVEDLDVVCPPAARRIPQPTVWFSSDVGVQTNEDGVVTGWRNQGSLGTALDVTAVGDGITLQAKRYGDKPAVVFPGGSTHTNYLTAAGTSALGLHSIAGATLFQVYQPNATLQSGKWPNWGLQIDANTRFFTDMANNQFRAFWFQGAAIAFSDGIGEVPRLMTVKTTKIVNALYSSVSLYKNTRFRDVANVGRAPVEGTFLIGYGGHEGACAGNSFNGSIAEFRLYNIELTATEQFAVECELAAKYGLSVEPDGDAPIPGEALAGFTGDPMAFGTEPHGLQGPNQTNATSAALDVRFVGMPAARSTNVVYVAHDSSAATSTRSWVVIGAAGARAVPITLTFSGDDFTGLQAKHLYFRAANKQLWSCLDITPQAAENGVSFTLPAGWASGQYCMAYAPLVPALWVRAEDAVTDVNGIVTSVTNRGSLASVVEFRPGSSEDGAGAIRKMSSETMFGGAAYLDFDRSYLESTTETDLGIETPFAGSAWFVVFRIPDFWDQGSLAGGLFGWASGDNHKRFCAFLANGFEGLVIRTHMFGGALDASAIGLQGKDMLLSFTGFETVGNLKGVDLLDGVVTNAANGMWDAAVTPWTGKVRVGNDALPWSANAWAQYLKGAIAEIRFYNRPLTAVERAEIELELSARYHLAVSAVGTLDGAAYATHRVDGQVFGDDPNCGSPVTPRMTWQDSVLSFGFASAPASSARSLVYVGSDGASGTLAPSPRNRYEEQTGRTWYVATSVPDSGGVFRFVCDTEKAQNWIYSLGYKADGAVDFIRLPDEPIIGDGVVTFACATLENGTYRLIRRRANVGTWVLFR